MMINIKGNEKVLVCPLGWGLGHASRVIPIISHLLSKGCTVLVAGDNLSISLLRKRFPNLVFISFPSISVRLSLIRFQFFSYFLIGLKVLCRTFAENRELKKITEEHKIDLVISDNRYGLYSKGIPSYLVTHQLWIQFPKPFKWAEPIGKWFVKNYAERFWGCLIPDNPDGFRFSGKLSAPKNLPQNTSYIGLLSRFKDFAPKNNNITWDLVGISSGPSPHRERLIDELVKLSNRLNLKALIIQGDPSDNTPKVCKGKVTFVSHLAEEEFAYALLGARFVICRSGYSTIMDLVALKRTALLVPTPGQTEQEYLAKYLPQNGVFNFCSQQKLGKIEIEDLERISGIYKTKSAFFFGVRMN